MHENTSGRIREDGGRGRKQHRKTRRRWGEGGRRRGLEVPAATDGGARSVVPVLSVVVVVVLFVV